MWLNRARLARLGATLACEARLALRRSPALLVAGGLLYLALVLARHRLVTQLGLTYAQAWNSGLWIGLLFDLWGVLLVALFAQALAGLTPIPARFAWAPAALFMWLAAFANVLHYQWFGTQLDLWVVALHIGDLLQVRGSTVQLGSSWPLVLGLLLCLASIGVALFGSRLGLVPPESPKLGFWRSRRRGIAQALVLLLALSLVHRLPPWLDAGKGTTLVAANIVRVWARQVTARDIYVGVGTDWTETLRDAQGMDPKEPSRRLARYRRFGREGEPADDFLLRRELEPDPEATRAVRARLGLPEEGPLHVIMLFLESVRAFEVFHAEYGPELFGELRQVLARHAIEFRQTYSSSFTAGQTVRGQFSTLCSMLPNMTGAATYLAHNSVEVRCLQQLLKENGYRTAWMNSFRDTYHGKRTFETLHGTELFFDNDELRARGVTETNGAWGLADKPFLLEVVALMEELAEEGKPVFVNALTISAHHPYRPIPTGALSEKMVAATASSPYYHDFLTGLRYEGIAVGAFFERLFASPLAGRTLVVLLADHSAGVGPTVELTPVQVEEMRFRVPLAFVTRDMPEPAVLHYPAHQVDVAPTVARIVGISGEVTWIGRDLFSGSGSPWVYQVGDGLSYRAGNRACYSRRRDAMRCIAIDGQDPLFEPSASVAEDPELTQFFLDTVRANMLAIVLNLVE